MDIEEEVAMQVRTQVAFFPNSIQGSILSLLCTPREMVTATSSFPLGRWSSPRKDRRGRGTQECSSNGQNLEFIQVVSEPSVQNLGRRMLELQGREDTAHCCSLRVPLWSEGEGKIKKEKWFLCKFEIFLLNHNKENRF